MLRDAGLHTPSERPYKTLTIVTKPLYKIMTIVKHLIMKIMKMIKQVSQTLPHLQYHCLVKQIAPPQNHAIGQCCCADSHRATVFTLF